MNMPPIARKWYMSLLLLAVVAYVASVGYRGVQTWQKFQERNALLASEHSDLMLPLAKAITDYTAKNDGRLPKDIPLAQLLDPGVAPPYQRFFENTGDQIAWNAAIDTIQPVQGGRRILLWRIDDRYPHYACAITCTGQTSTAEIIPRAELQDLTGTPAKLK